MRSTVSGGLAELMNLYYEGMIAGRNGLRYFDQVNTGYTKRESPCLRYIQRDLSIR